ncbi:MAG: class B sortase [Clostridiales bacterium]|nr:class B sortase [Clostridiales bacterium]
MASNQHQPQRKSSPQRQGKQSNKKKNQNQTIGNKVFYIATQALLCAILFFTVGKIGEKAYAYISESQDNAKLKEEYGISFASPTPSSNAAGATARPVPAYPIPTPKRYTYPQGVTLEQVQALKEKNEDFVCWLYIPDTTISYNVMQAEDNEYYLHTTIDHKYASSGSLFLDFRNNAETLEGHTIIYGHNMQDGSMFGNLLKYYNGTDDTYLREHPYLYTYAENGVGIWQIFSVYETTTDEYYIETYFETQEAYYSFIKDLQNKSVYKTDVLLKATDDVMTLSTCYKFHSENGRLVVNAVRVGTAPLL